MECKNDVINLRIIARKTLKLFWEKYADAEQPLKAWYEIIRSSIWDKSGDVREVFRSADIVPNNRIVFNIKGNKYRLVVKVQYDFKIIYIRFIGMHEEYNKIDVTNI